MSDEKKENSQLPDNTDAGTASVPADGDKALSEELEQLKDTFQEEYDKTSAQATAGPVIQELEEGEDADEDDASGQSDMTAENADASDNNGKKKKEKKKHRGLAAVLIILCVLIIVPLLAYFILSVTNPDFSSLVNCVVSATAADEASDKVTYYEKALDYCKEDSSFAGVRQMILEDIVMVKAESDGYATALSYMKDKMTEEEIAAASGSDFKAFLKVADVIDTVSDKAFSAVTAAMGDKTDEPDYDAILKEIGSPAIIASDMKAVLQNIALGLIAEKTGDTETAVSDFMTAYNSVTALGAKGQDLLERTALSMYNNGYAYEAQAVITTYMTGDMTAAPINAEFTAMRSELQTAGDFPQQFYDLAVGVINLGDTENADYTSLVTGLGEYSAPVAKMLASLVENCVKAINAENNHNLTEAVKLYTSVLTTSEAFGLTENKVIEKTVTLLFTSGYLSDAQSYGDKYVTDDFLTTASDEFKADYSVIKAVSTSFENAYKVFYPYYSAYSQSGTAIDKAKVTAELDALITSSSTNYDKAGVCYYKYIAEYFTDADKATMSAHIEAFSKQVPDLIYIYGYDLLECYVADGAYDKAVTLANKMLQVNIADDYCNYILALKQRIDGNLTEAMTIALKGVELSENGANCLRQAAILSILSKDYTNAYNYVKLLYDNQLSRLTGELVAIFSAVYDGTDETITAGLKEMNDYVTQAFSYNGISLTDSAQAVVDGTKTVEDIFLNSPYDVA